LNKAAFDFRATHLPMFLDCVLHGGGEAVSAAIDWVRGRAQRKCTFLAMGLVTVGR
jgi:hypothetical protein